MQAVRKRRIRRRHGGWLAVDVIVMLYPTTQMEWKLESVKKRNKVSVRSSVTSIGRARKKYLGGPLKNIKYN
jgi:hypothetical protein